MRSIKTNFFGALRTTCAQADTRFDARFAIVGVNAVFTTVVICTICGSPHFDKGFVLWRRKSIGRTRRSGGWNVRSCGPRKGAWDGGPLTLAGGSAVILGILGSLRGLSEATASCVILLGVILAAADELALVFPLQERTIAKAAAHSLIALPLDEVKGATEGVAHAFGIFITEGAMFEESVNDIRRTWGFGSAAGRLGSTPMTSGAVSESSLAAANGDACGAKRWGRWNCRECAYFRTMLRITSEAHRGIVTEGFCRLGSKVELSLLTLLPEMETGVSVSPVLETNGELCHAFKFSERHTSLKKPATTHVEATAEA